MAVGSTVRRPAHRIALYTPADSDALFDAALASGPDVVVIDMEDGVAADDKPLARLGLAGLVRRAGLAGIAAVIRVNGVDTPWFVDDVAASIDAGMVPILLPKAGPDATQVLTSELARAGHRVGVWVLTERLRDVLAVHRTAALPGVAALVIGYGDLAKELGADPSIDQPEFDGVRRLVADAALQHGRQAYDGVHVGPTALVEETTLRGMRAGLTGRTFYRGRHVEAWRSRSTHESRSAVRNGPEDRQ